MNAERLQAELDAMEDMERQRKDTEMSRRTFQSIGSNGSGDEPSRLYTQLKIGPIDPHTNRPSGYV